MCPFLHKIIHNECERSSTFYFRHFKELDALFGPMLLKVKSGGFDGIVVMVPLLTCNTSPSVTDGLLCEGYTLTLCLAEDVLPELSNTIQFH